MRLHRREERLILWPIIRLILKIRVDFIADGDVRQVQAQDRRQQKIHEVIETADHHGAVKARAHQIGGNAQSIRVYRANDQRDADFELSGLSVCRIQKRAGCVVCSGSGLDLVPVEGKGKYFGTRLQHPVQLVLVCSRLGGRYIDPHDPALFVHDTGVGRSAHRALEQNESQEGLR